MSIATLLGKLAAVRGPRPLQPPATATAIDALALAVRERFGIELSAELRELYAIADGIDHDGLQIFATARAPFASTPSRSINGLLEMNDAYGDFGGLEGRVIVGNDNGPVIWGLGADATVKLVTAGSDLTLYPSLLAALDAELAPRLAPRE